MNNTVNELVSVIIPVYNVEKYLNRCIKSVLGQTYKNLEIILVDDGSTDNSSQICDEYKKIDSRIIVIHKENGGLSDARNAGINKATGKYITFIDSDDSIEKDMIEYLYLLMKKYKTKMSLCCHNIIYEKRNKVISLGNGKEEVLSSEKCIEKMLYHKDVDTSAWAKLYAKNLFDDISYPKGFLFEDIGTTYKLFIESKYIACGYENKYNYWIRKNSIVTGVFSEKKLDLLKMTDTMGEDVIKLFPNLKRAILRRRVYARFSTLNQMLNIDDYEGKRKKIIDFILNNKNDVLFNKLTPIRDKIAIIVLSLNFNLYKFLWNLKCKS